MDMCCVPGRGLADSPPDAVPGQQSERDPARGRRCVPPPLEAARAPWVRAAPATPPPRARLSRRLPDCAAARHRGDQATSRSPRISVARRVASGGTASAAAANGRRPARGRPGPGPPGSSAGPGEGPLCGCSWQDGAGGGGEEAAAGPQRARGGDRRRPDQRGGGGPEPMVRPRRTRPGREAAGLGRTVGRH